MSVSLSVVFVHLLLATTLRNAINRCFSTLLKSFCAVLHFSPCHPLICGLWPSAVCMASLCGTVVQVQGRGQLQLRLRRNNYDVKPTVYAHQGLSAICRKLHGVVANFRFWYTCRQFCCKDLSFIVSKVAPFI